VPKKVGALADYYDFSSCDQRVQKYLLAFRDIEVGSVILLPDKDRPGVLYIGDVVSRYEYNYSPPEHPYECAHRVGVRWDRRSGTPVEYAAADLGISIRGGFWTRAFHRIDGRRRPELIERIDSARRVRFPRKVASS
jgi:hypothetical protein